MRPLSFLNVWRFFVERIVKEIRIAGKICYEATLVVEYGLAKPAKDLELVWKQLA